MSTDDYGTLSLVTALQSVLVCVVSLQLSASLPRFYFDYTGEQVKTFFSTIVYSVALITFSLLGAIHFLGEPLIQFIYPKAGISYYPYFLMCLVMVFFAQIAQVALRLLVVQERGLVVLKRKLIVILFGIAVGIYFVIIRDMRVMGALWGLVLTGLFDVIISLYLVRSFFVLKWKRDYFRLALNFSLPIIPHALGGYLFMYSDKIVMEKYVSLATIGIYNVADKMAMLLKILVNSINDALSPVFMKKATADLSKAVQDFRPMITKWAVIIAFAYLGMAFFSNIFVELLMPEQYHAAGALIPVLLVAYIFRGFYTFSSYPLFFLKKTKVIPVITFSAGLVNVVLNVILIPRFGFFTAAWTTVISFMITFLLAIYFSSRYQSMSFEWRKILSVFGLMLVFLILGHLYVPQSIWLESLLKIGYILVFGSILYLKNVGAIRDDIVVISEAIMTKK